MVKKEGTLVWKFYTLNVCIFKNSISKKIYFKDSTFSSKLRSKRIIFPKEKKEKQYGKFL